MNLGRILAALRRHPLVADLTLAVALAALAAVTGLALVAPRAQLEPPSTPVMVAWAVALAAPLVLRRRWPLVVLDGVDHEDRRAVGRDDADERAKRAAAVDVLESAGLVGGPAQRPFPDPGSVCLAWALRFSSRPISVLL